jgi:hypothetical protein
MLSANFLSFLILITNGAQLCIDESVMACRLYCTNSGWRCICHFSLALAYNLYNPPANGKHGLIPEEIYQTLLINKKQGNMD